MTPTITCAQDGKTFHPVVLGEVLLDAMDGLGKLSFRAANFPVRNGAMCRLSLDKTPVFTGYVFNIQNSIEQVEGQATVQICACDTMRYLRNTDSFNEPAGTAGTLLRSMGKTFKLPIGDIQDGGKKYEGIAEKDKSLLFVLQKRLNGLTIRANGVGKLEISPIGTPKLPICVTKHHCQSVDRTSEINSKTYNRVKLVSTKKGEQFFNEEEDKKTIGKWGVLQVCETVSPEDNTKEHATEILRQTNHPTEELKIGGVLGDPRFVPGCSFEVDLPLIGKKTVIAKGVRHRFEGDGYFCDMDVRVV